MSNVTNWVMASPLGNGPLSQDNYSYSVTGLCENTVYQYRAYVVISGTPYYGETKTITTCYDISTPPTVSTGCAYDATATTMRMCDNVVTTQGSFAVCEYGVLYTQNQSYSSPTTLVLPSGKVPNVCVKSTCATIPTGQTYYLASGAEICNLAANTMTYYRAFAINSAGVAYGAIKSQITSFPVYLSKTINLVRTLYPSINCSTGLICMDPALAGGEAVSVIVNVEHLTTTGSLGTTVTEITCSSGGGESAPVGIFYCSTSAGCVSVTDVTIPITSGDTITWSQSVNGDSGSCAVIKVCNVDTVTCLNAIISSRNYSNVSYSSSLGEHA